MAKPRRCDWLFRPQLADEDLPLSAEALFAEALAELPAVERSALALSEIGGLDNNEIAERLGTNPVVVRRLLVRAAVGGTVRVEAVTAERRSVRLGAGLQGDGDVAVESPAEPPVVRERPAPAPPPAEPETVAVTLPLPVTPEPPLPLPLPAPPVELPPVALPDLPPLP